jgi:hypothetical protein
LEPALKSARLDAETQRKKTAALLGGLMASLDKGAAAEIAPLIKGKSIGDVMETLASKLPDPMPDKFRFAAQGFEHKPTRQEYLARLASLNLAANLAEGVPESLFHAALIAKQQADATGNVTRSDLDRSLALAGETELSALRDPDFALPIAKELGKLWKYPDQTDYAKLLINPSSRVLENVLGQRVQVKQALGAKLTIREVDPGLGIFRGCAGGDCSSQFSFPYPNDSHERVFFIYDARDQLKGYVNATELDQDGKTTLYAITTSGSRLNENDSRMVLNALHKERAALGVDQISLPPPDRLDALLNFLPVRTIYADYAARGPARPIRYRDLKDRMMIEKFESPYNKGHYDHVAGNTQAVPFSGDAKVLGSIRTTHTTYALPDRTVPLNRADLAELALELEGSGRSKQLKPILAHAGIPSAQIKALSVALHNEAKLPIDRWLSDIGARASRMGTPELMSHAYLFEEGRFRSPDAFSSAHADESVALILKDLKEFDPNDPEPHDWSLVDAHRSEILAHLKTQRWLESLRKTIQDSPHPEKMGREALLLAGISGGGAPWMDTFNAVYSAAAPDQKASLLGQLGHTKSPAFSPLLLHEAKRLPSETLPAVFSAMSAIAQAHPEVLPSLINSDIPGPRQSMSKNFESILSLGKSLPPGVWGPVLTQIGHGYDFNSAYERQTMKSALEKLQVDNLETQHALLDTLSSGKVPQELRTEVVKVLARSSHADKASDIKLLSLLKGLTAEAKRGDFELIQLGEALGDYVAARAPIGPDASKVLSELVRELQPDTGPFNRAVYRVLDRAGFDTPGLRAHVDASLIPKFPHAELVPLYGRFHAGQSDRAEQFDYFLENSYTASDGARGIARLLRDHPTKLARFFSRLKEEKPTNAAFEALASQLPTHVESLIAVLDAGKKHPKSADGAFRVLKAAGHPTHPENSAIAAEVRRFFESPEISSVPSAAFGYLEQAGEFRKAHSPYHRLFAEKLIATVDPESSGKLFVVLDRIPHPSSAFMEELAKAVHASGEHHLTRKGLLERYGSRPEIRAAMAKALEDPNLDQRHEDQLVEGLRRHPPTSSCPMALQRLFEEIN